MTESARSRRSHGLPFHGSPVSLRSRRHEHQEVSGTCFRSSFSRIRFTCGGRTLFHHWRVFRRTFESSQEGCQGSALRDATPDHLDRSPRHYTNYSSSNPSTLPTDTSSPPVNLHLRWKIVWFLSLGGFVSPSSKSLQNSPRRSAGGNWPWDTCRIYINLKFFPGSYLHVLSLSGSCVYFGNILVGFRCIRIPVAKTSIREIMIRGHTSCQ